MTTPEPPKWIYPEDDGHYPTPGKDLLILTIGGVPIISPWRDGELSGFVAWCELPVGKRPLKKKYER